MVEDDQAKSCERTLCGESPWMHAWRCVVVPALYTIYEKLPRGADVPCNCFTRRHIKINALADSNRR
jgi:hypothetical protein